MFNDNIKWTAALILILFLPVYDCTNTNVNIERNRGYYNTDFAYVELVLVINKQVYASIGNDAGEVYRICTNIISIVNSLYHPLNISVALVDVVIWTDQNFVETSSNITKTLQDFLEYRRKYLVSDHPNDCAFLMVDNLIGDVLGISIPDSICSYKYSGGLIFFSSERKVVAMTIAHEIAHMFGVIHDTPECECQGNSCIMDDGLDSIVPVIWSSCSIDQMNLAISRGMDYCLRNKPIPLLEQCGNGFVEPGEQCDCGLEDYCKNSCCNASTCTLYPNATCGTGECCNLNTCDLHTTSTECRKMQSECDIPEFCSGKSEFCPADSFKRNTEPCNQGKSYCYKGVCPSHTDQCKLLYGSSGHSFDGCYINNLQGSANGDCGYNIANQTYKKCVKKNQRCGRLQCTHWSKHLYYGSERNSIFSQSPVNYKRSTISCQTVSIDMGLQNVDPGMVPDGAKCGNGRVCIRQKCFSLKELSSQNFFAGCRENCSGHGTCDNVGHCHCDVGFEAPLCKAAVPGEPSIEKDDKTLTIITYIVLPGVIPFLLLALLFVYIWKYNPNTIPVEELPAPTILETEV